MENEQWLEPLQPFTSVRDMVLSRHWVRRVAPALQELAGERTTGALPAFQNLIGTCQRNDSEVHCRATPLRSSRGSSLVVRGLVVNV